MAVRLVQLRYLAFIAWMIVISPSAYALSCYGLRDHFFIQCEKGACENAFRAREVRERGACKRRVTVEYVNNAMVQTINRELLKISPTDTGVEIYHIVLIEDFYKNSAPRTAGELAEHIRVEYPRYAKSFNTVELIKERPDIEKLKTQWQETESTELMRIRLELLIDVVMLACGFTLLIFTLKKFKELAGDISKSSKNRGKILWLVLVQVGLFCVGLADLFFIWGFLYFVMPIIALVWVYEIFLFNGGGKRKSSRHDGAHAEQSSNE